MFDKFDVSSDNFLIHFGSTGQASRLGVMYQNRFEVYSEKHYEMIPITKNDRKTFTVYGGNNLGKVKVDKLDELLEVLRGGLELEDLDREYFLDSI